MLVIAIGFSGLYSIMFFIVFNNSQSMSNETGAILTEMAGFSFDVSGFVAVNVHTSWHVVYHAVGAFLMILSSTVVIVSSLQVWNFTRHHRMHIAAATREATTQMTIILSIQAAVPFVFCFVPISVFILHSFMLHNDPTIPMMTIPAISLFPTINSILATIFMKSYRCFIILNVKKCCMRLGLLNKQ
uniref:G protein-coupled receptor n=1 Tax=Panagrellus redivivus TaxID=6233 RepID=A0A7E4V7B4_PANRE